MKPTYKINTVNAINALSKKLGIPFEPYMQDWSYTEGKPEAIETYIAHYNVLNKNDEKFVLMELIIQAIEDQPKEELFIKYYNIIAPILKNDFELHASTIYYWACFDNDDIDNCWHISKLMRQLWIACNNNIL